MSPVRPKLVQLVHRAAVRLAKWTAPPVRPDEYLTLNGDDLDNTYPVIGDPLEEAREYAEEGAATPTCCWRCAREARTDDPFAGPSRMIVCPACGDKRCQRAEDHRRNCPA